MAGENSAEGTRLAGWDGEVEPPESLGFVGREMQVRGQAVGARIVERTTVPEDYPISIDTARVLAIQFRVDNPVEPDEPDETGTDSEPISAYFAWPSDRPDERLQGLLELQGLCEFADLHGETVLLALEGDYYVPAIPDSPRGDPRGVYGIGIGLVPYVIVAGAGIFGVGLDALAGSPAFIAAWAVATVIVLPLSTYLDAAYLASSTTWTGSPNRWTVAAAIPALNLVALALYLLRRRGVEPIVA